MKLLAFLLISSSLVLGLIGAMTAYAPPLTMPDDRLVGLTLNAPAGRKPSADGRRDPIATKGATVDPALLAALRDSGETRVKVKEFALARWTGLPWFALGCVGLATGAWLARREARRALLAAGAGARATESSPEATFAAIRRVVDELRSDPAPPAERAAAQRRILDALTPVQESLVPAFVATRDLLIARLGMGGYARLMDRFAAAERQINRAWSAAADGYLEEARERLELAAGLLGEAHERWSAVDATARR